MFAKNNSSNPLNVFPSTSSPTATQVKLEQILSSSTNRPPTEIQRTLAYTLFDDGVEYMTTLFMNRAASYTFGFQNSYARNPTSANVFDGTSRGESISNQMWDLLIDNVLNRPSHHSVLALTKTIHLIHHVLLHGSEHCVMNVDLLYRIELAVSPLRHLNTALVEQQTIDSILNNEVSGLENDGGFQLSSLSVKATATLFKLRGGSVDKGLPVRNAASKLFDMISTANNLQQLRMEQNLNRSSLVPVGSSKQVGFITDEARYELLQHKMKQEENVLQQKERQNVQQIKETRSNLAGVSASDAFGGGFSSKASLGGSQVVGAAHSLEDMIKSAKSELEQHKLKQQQKIATLKKGYSDDPHNKAHQIKEFERKSNWQNDRKMMEQEKALRDALEYLEDLKREEREKVNNFLDNNFDSRGVTDATTTTDLLGFDLVSAQSPTEDLLDLDTAVFKPVSSQSVSDLDPFNAPPHVNVNGVDSNNVDTAHMGPSLVTGDFIQSDSFRNDQSDLLGLSMINNGTYETPISANETHRTDYVFTDGLLNNTSPLDQYNNYDSDKSRKMEMARGIFAGIASSETAPPVILSQDLPSSSVNDPFLASNTVSKIPIMGLDTSPPTHSPFGIVPMGGSSTHVAQHSSSIPLSPPPAMPPPPPPPSAVSDVSSALEKEEILRMMMQQQNQMQEMMKMLASMGMNPPPHVDMNSMISLIEQQDRGNEVTDRGINASFTESSHSTK